MKKIFNNFGFTLVETLVAVTVLSLGVIGAFTAAQIGISSSILSKEQIIAVYLADEGIETIRNLRDQNGINGVAWLTNIANNSSDPCYFGKTCRVDVVNNALPLQCHDVGEATPCPVLQQDPVNGFYGYHNGWNDTLYTREISIDTVPSNNLGFVNREVAITVTVSWSKGLINRQFKIRENIFNWQ
ncbi:prepilin-type N-terminal cleavage/methylation domain-containing protein [Candidatus Parcubacteria bacterium]|nr:prepilin-type N-terminal cleavage/methylation domain-containing protein [Candidatus Parcubacteria bacterium]